MECRGGIVAGRVVGWRMRGSDVRLPVWTFNLIATLQFVVNGPSVQ